MPIYAGVGESSNRDYKSAIIEAVSQAKTNLKQKDISLAIVFSTPEFAFAYALKTIRSLIGSNVPLIGATSCAVLTQEGITNHGIAIAFISAKDAYFNCASVKGTGSDLQTRGEELAKKLLFGLKDIPRRFGIIICDGLINNNLPLLKGLQERLGQSFPIIGATQASDNIHLNKTYQYLHQEVFTNSVVGLLWAGKINFGLGIKHGWKPIGKPHRVTLSDNYVIKEVDQKPAVTLYQDYFAKDAPNLKKELKHISILYPIGIYLSGEEEYLLRNILSIEDDGSLICRGEIPVNSQIRLMIGTKESALSTTQEAVQDAKQSLLLQAFPQKVSASLIFVFNSISRLFLLGRQITKELEIIKSNFPNTPIIGLCTYGEQAPLKAANFQGKTYCHNQSITLLAIG